MLTRFPDRPVGAAVRDPGRCADLAARGVDVRHGDYDDPATLRTAFRDADRLLLVSSPPWTARCGPASTWPRSTPSSRAGCGPSRTPASSAPTSPARRRARTPPTTRPNARSSTVDCPARCCGTRSTPTRSSTPASATRSPPAC
ncbi:hypothetical protein [Dactylosporangium cerinum]